MKEQLQCGAGKMKITPREEWLKDLRGLQDIEFTGILDDLYVRALLFDDGCEKSLIVTFDLDKVPHPGLLPANAGTAFSDTGTEHNTYQHTYAHSSCDRNPD